MLSLYSGVIFFVSATAEANSIKELAEKFNKGREPSKALLNVTVFRNSSTVTIPDVLQAVEWMHQQPATLSAARLAWYMQWLVVRRHVWWMVMHPQLPRELLHPDNSMLLHIVR